jgi:hypothetical protein
MTQLKAAARKRGTLLGAGLGSIATLVAVVGLGLLAGVGAAAGSPPKNTAPPTISGQPNVDQTLTADPGTWSGTQPISFKYQWRRCDSIGGACADISGATSKTYTLQHIDAGNTLRVRVTASNSAGSASATSVPTAVIKSNPVTGCPPGNGTVSVSQVAPPARLVIDQQQYSPSVLTKNTKQFTARYHVSDTCGQSVSGALVYSTGVPYHQLNNASEQTTDSTGWATVNFTMINFPATPHQQLLAMFVRARKPGENLLAGISTRRLVSVSVNVNT